MAAPSQMLVQPGAPATSTTYDRFAGAAGLVAGAAGVLYAIAFLVQRSALLSGLWLLIGAVASLIVLVALYRRLAMVDGEFARLALALSGIGAVGALVHGGYDLANAINPPPEVAASMASLPSAIDPRGLLTFGIAGLGVLGSAWLMQRSGSFPRGLVMLGFVLAVLLVGLYLGRLIVLDATSPLIVAPALLCGFIVNPLWNIWLVVMLWSHGAH